METDFLYSKGVEENIKKTLEFSQKHGRITIHEWRNFIDYDIIFLMRCAVETYIELSQKTSRSKE